MDKEEYIRRLRELQTNEDTERAHPLCDTILCEILVELGYEDIVDEYDKVDKWYS